MNFDASDEQLAAERSKLEKLYKDFPLVWLKKQSASRWDEVDIAAMRQTGVENARYLATRSNGFEFLLATRTEIFNFAAVQSRVLAATGIVIAGENYAGQGKEKRQNWEKVVGALIRAAGAAQDTGNESEDVMNALSGMPRVAIDPASAVSIAAFFTGNRPANEVSDTFVVPTLGVKPDGAVVLFPELIVARTRLNGLHFKSVEDFRQVLKRMHFFATKLRAPSDRGQRPERRVWESAPGLAQQLWPDEYGEMES